MAKQMTIVTNPFQGASQMYERDNPSSSMMEDLNPKRGVGSAAVALGGAGVAVVTNNLMARAVARGSIRVGTAGAIQMALGLLGGAALAAMGMERLGTAFAAGQFTFGTATLVEVARQRMAARAPAPPAPNPNPAPPAPNPAPSQGLHGLPGRAYNGYGPQQQQQQRQAAPARV